VMGRSVAIASFRAVTLSNVGVTPSAAVERANRRRRYRREQKRRPAAFAAKHNDLVMLPERARSEPRHHYLR
jgi:hypothetical protein